MVNMPLTKKICDKPGRDLVARLARYIPSAEDWADNLNAWTGVAISYSGLKALGLPAESLESFPLAFGRAWPSVPDNCMI